MKASLIFVLALILAFCVQAQDRPFSNISVMDTYGSETFPYVKGEVKISQIQPDDYSPEIPRCFADRYIDRIDHLINIIAGWQKLNPPQGLEADFYSFIKERNDKACPTCENRPRSYAAGVTTSFLPYYKGEDGDPYIDTRVGAHLYMWFNDPDYMVGDPLISDIYVCPRKTADFYGYPIYQTNRDEITIVSKKGKPFFIPVSQAEFISANISFWENEIKKSIEEQRDPENNVSMKDVIEGGRAERQKDMEKAYNELLKYDKEAAEALMSSFRETEAQLAVEARSTEGGYTRNDMLENSNALAEQMIRELKSELALLTPAQRGKQAHYNINAMEIYNNFSGLVPFEAAIPWENCEPLIRVNDEVVDPDSPEFQLIVIEWSVLFLNTESHQSPRLYSEDKYKHTGHAGDDRMVELYGQKDLWMSIFDLVKE